MTSVLIILFTVRTDIQIPIYYVLQRTSLKENHVSVIVTKLCFFFCHNLVSFRQSLVILLLDLEVSRMYLNSELKSS